jgi:hypothetical protein
VYFLVVCAEHDLALGDLLAALGDFLGDLFALVDFLGDTLFLGDAFKFQNLVDSPFFGDFIPGDFFQKPVERALLFLTDFFIYY